MVPKRPRCDGRDARTTFPRQADPSPDDLTLVPMLHVHRSERADALVAALRAILADPPEDPFASEVVAVPTRGMERWLTQQAAAHLGASPGREDGICANVLFPSPRRLVADAVAAASGVDPETDPWRPERAVWPLLEVIDAHRREDWLGPLNTHLCAGGDSPLRARRFAAARHLAGLYDRYAANRPELLRAWAAGGGDGGWQAELWRRLAARLPEADPASRVDHACARVREEPALVALPDRFALVGLTRLPPAELAVLRALAAHRDVHLFLLHPSPALWARVADVARGPVRRDDDPTARLPRHPLLASWGRDAREMQLPLATEPFADHHHPAAPPPDTLLGRIQAGVREDRPPADPAPLDPADASLRIHSCHGRARQVEVVRDAVLHLLREDPTLEPRDVIVMCPDIEAFAPLIHATFGAGEVTDDEAEALPEGVRPTDLRVRLADRSLRQTNPVLGVVAQLVDLAGQRLTASQVLDVADREPVRRRFGFDDDDVSRLESWVSEAGIRWGLDAEHRAPFKLDKVPDGTWRHGLDRLLLGVTMPEEGRGLWSDVLPLDDVESGAIDLAGRFAELLDRLGAVLDALAAPKAVAAWATALADAADALTATPPRETWPRTELQYLLDDLVEEATRGGTPSGVELSLPELRVLLADRLAGRPTRANFRTGHLTVCTLMPMRSVPHRVVCLLGMDDGAFPRKASRDGDDLVLGDPHVGDRDPRTEDRQMLLDALLAATDRLVVTFTGHDERTNTPRPPAVPVGELLDVIDRTVRTPGGGRARDHVVVTHPLQPFDPRNFTVGRL